MRRFWMMLAHYHGQTWNGSELARAFGMSESSVRRYLDILEGAYAVWPGKGTWPMGNRIRAVGISDP
jgi:predicted AAA+ superfamily ATPase